MNLLEAIELHLPRGYTIQGKLGAGGTSSVYLATSLERDERLAVKVMLVGSVNDDSVDRFLREMQLLKRLDHPRIVRLLQPGEANGALFFTMPYIDGQTLRERLQIVGTLTVRESLLVTRDIADALGHAHAKGVVHRDVKPENIFLAEDGAYLIDFGYANGPGDAGGKSAFIAGTPAYMSPEQVAGKRVEDWRSDYFSLGCVLHEMLAGRPPFASDSARATMARRATEAAPDVRSLRSDVPDDVAAIITRSLDSDPARRYATAGFLRSALDAALQRLDERGEAAPRG
jgi:serine/threonine-protein kinase